MKPVSTNEMDRRAVLKGAAAGVVGSGLAGTAVLEPTDALAEDKKALQDAAITTATVSFKNGPDTINGFLARPKSTALVGGVILMPGIFGITDYMKESTAQVAQAGLVGLCVDFYSREGGAPKTDD